MNENNEHAEENSILPDTEAADTITEADGDALSAAQLAGIDLISSIAIFCFGLYVFASGIYMCFFAVTGAQAWYYAPGVFPCFIGTVLMLVSVLLFLKKRRAGAAFGKTTADAPETEEKKRARGRLLLAIALFAVYVFVMIGRLHFLLSTFAYLAVTMIVFRKEDYPVWKLLLISAAATGAVYLFFGVIASVPLP